MSNQNRFLIVGANGQLGKEFQRELAIRGLDFFAPDERDLDITDFGSIDFKIEHMAPSILINCAAFNAVEDAETKTELAHLINEKSVENLATICKRRSIFMVHYSSDYVFDGKKGDLYTEQDAPNPLNVYGKSKLAGELAVRNILTESLVFRTSWVFGDGNQNFIHKLLGWAAQNRVLKLSSDEVSVPTSTRDLVALTLRSIEKKLTGFYHLTNSGYASRYEWGKFVLELLGRESVLIPVPMNAFPSAAVRPGFSPMSNRQLATALGVDIPDWREAVKSFLSK
jgi:dTDP-4-dehydrorhamnose reductase